MIVSGRQVVNEGRHVGIDVGAELREAIGAFGGDFFSHTERNST